MTGILNSLYFDLSNLAITLDIIPNVRVLIYTEREQVNYLNNINYTLTELDWLSSVLIILLIMVTLYLVLQNRIH